MCIPFNHNWEIIHKCLILSEYVGFGGGDARTHYHLRCKKCGKMKDKSLRGFYKKPNEK